jgi:hypothetical protein
MFGLQCKKAEVSTVTAPDTSLCSLALNTLSTIYEEQRRYDKANAVIRQIEADFPATLLPMSGACNTSVVRLLDAILGDEIASYFLYEAANMKNGGGVTERDGKEYPIKTIEDVRAYVFRNVL